MRLDARDGVLAGNENFFIAAENLDGNVVFGELVAFTREVFIYKVAKKIRQFWCPRQTGRYDIEFGVLGLIDNWKVSSLHLGSLTVPPLDYTKFSGLETSPGIRPQGSDYDA